MSTAKEMKLWVCQKHINQNYDSCVHCRVSIDFNVSHRRCACGEKAIGYRVLTPDSDVEFFCDVHFQGMPTEERA